MMAALRRALRDQRGFTLAELLVTLSIVGFVIGVGYLVLLTLDMHIAVLEKEAILSADARSALDQITREIRQAQEIQDGQGAFETAESDTCSFYTDLDRDGTPERITYYVVGDSLFRTVGLAGIPVYPYDFSDGAAETVIHSFRSGWSGDVFSYWNDEDPPQAVGSGESYDVSAVEVSLTNAAETHDREVSVEYTTWVKIRAVHNTLD